jgi:hypothetical protein
LGRRGHYTVPPSQLRNVFALWTFFDDGDLARVGAETRNILRTEAAKAFKVFPIPSIEKISDQLSDEGILRNASRDRGGLEL